MAGLRETRGFLFFEGDSNEAIDLDFLRKGNVGNGRHVNCNPALQQVRWRRVNPVASNLVAIKLPDFRESD